WSSLRTRAEPLALERIELDAPVFDLPRLQAWLALRPTGGDGLPSLSEGVTVRDGRVLAAGCEVSDLQLRLHGYRADAPLAANARGSLFLASPARIHFDLQLAASRPANGAGIGVRGPVRVEHADWTLPAFITASGPLQIADGRVHVTPLRFGADADRKST